MTHDAVTRYHTAEEALVSEGLHHKHVAIKGMDGFFTYQLELKQV
jgi:hypothetical protein